MRIAIDANVLDSAWGGIPKYTSRIAEQLAGDDELLLLANTRRLAYSVKGAHEIGRRVKGTSLWRQGFLPAWLAAARPDVLWAPESVLPRVCPVPSVVTIHDLAALRFAGVKPATHERRFRTAVARSARRAERVLAVSRATAADIEALFGIDAREIRVVPNGVDDLFTPGDRGAARAAVRERWGIEEPFALHVGSLEPRKGLDVLIEAAALAAEQGGGWKAVLVGTPGFGGEQIEAKAHATPGCVPLGAVSDGELLTLMRAAGALAAPAIYEGFGIAPLEAMACDTPAVIADDSGGLVEISGEAAIVVAERSAAAWKAALERAMRRPPQLIEYGRRHAAKFRWPEVAAQTREVLYEAAGRARTTCD